jgi:hypothetical protein
MILSLIPHPSARDVILPEGKKERKAQLSYTTSKLYLPMLYNYKPNIFRCGPAFHSKSQTNTGHPANLGKESVINHLNPCHLPIALAFLLTPIDFFKKSLF